LPPTPVYVSLNQDNPELKQILPWAGTHHDSSSFIDVPGTMFTWWANEQFEPTDIVGDDDDDRAAVFGAFRYRSHTLDMVVTSPFAILIRVADGLITYLQFMEDTYATAASFRSAWTVHPYPSGQQLKVPSN
jgi:uncharacterized protein